MGNPDWASQATWFVDPVNGDDCNIGDTALNPIKHYETIRTRVNDAFMSTTTVQLMGTTFGTDNPVRAWHNMKPASTFTLLGQNSTDNPALLLFGPSAITGVTALNRAANQPWEIAVAGIPVSWTASGLINAATSTPRRIRIVNSVNPTSIGAVAWAVKDLGAKNARISPFMTTASPIVVVTPVIGDTIVVEGLTTVSDYSMDMTTSSIVAAAGLTVPVNVRTLALANGAGNRPTVRNLIMTILAPTISYFGCDTGRLLFGGSEGVCGYQACKMAGVDIIASGNAHTLFGCAPLGTMVVRGGGNVIIDFDTIFEIGGILVDAGGSAIWGTGAVFDKAAGGVPDGITVRAGGIVLSRINLDVTNAIYGSGNAGVGLNVQSCAQAVYDTNKPTITGTAGDSKIGGVITAWGAVPATTAAELSAIRAQV